ncbi:putative transcription factor bZIP family [Rosa chinensis]|uniref:Putative transcription factor bZIP family n=1 Tax=Rosa chinensis TaxID=74649 RepID=A0A2P6PNU4_ROSCH|nr:G-box-binding factor 1 [Rosa chinensis]PRQ23600.1 putative transcription factor bZIP family [Rosa chinensis]
MYNKLQLYPAKNRNLLSLLPLLLFLLFGATNTLTGLQICYTMETRETSAASTQGVALEIQDKEERVLNEKDLEPMTPMTTTKEGSVDIELVGNRVADSEKDTSFSGNSGDGVSQGAAGRGEDSSDENADTNRDFSAIQKQIFNQMGAVQNNSRVLYSATDTNLKLLNIEVNMPETHPNSGLDLNVSSAHAIRTEEDHDRRRREKRKQSNRESAKRSRFRRQQECEKLRETAAMLNGEISELPNELRRLSEECGKLDEENSSLIDEMEKMYGPDAVADLRAVKVNSSDDGSNSIESKTPSRDNSTSPTPSHRKETSPTPPEPRLFGVSLRPNLADCLHSSKVQ